MTALLPHNDVSLSFLEDDYYFEGEAAERDPQVRRLQSAFGQPVAVYSLDQAERSDIPTEWLPVDIEQWRSLCEHALLCGRPEVLDEYSPLMLVAYPLRKSPDMPKRVAVMMLLVGRVNCLEDIESAANAFGVSPELAFEWSRGKSAWPAEGAVTLLGALHEVAALDEKKRSQQEQISDITGNLISTFEELNMLHRLTGRITISRSARDLCDQAIYWLYEVLSAECVIARWEWTNGKASFPGLKSGSTHDPNWLSFVQGKLPIPEEEIDAFFEQLGPEARQRPITLNRDRTSMPVWPFPSVSEVVATPIHANDRFLGWIAAINCKATRGAYEDGFSVAESSLLSSVAVILGVHAGNRRLFRLQTDLFNGSIHALTAAIDAKDRYTCGHSDRVARIAVRLAEHMGLNEEELETVYLGGLLHDIGKIGIDDHVLCKPDHLSKEEFEHIKTHPGRGMEILDGVPQLASVLPIVRHHHEAWDGSGYPDGLEGDECPKLARIVSVADALDAMGSDRVYRKGMPTEKVEEILRNGAGKQWDPEVVDAYFTIREELLAIQSDDSGQDPEPHHDAPVAVTQA